MTQDISALVQKNLKKLLADEAVQKALDFIRGDAESTFDELQEMVVMHGAPFKEHEVRSPMYRDKLEDYGADECTIDDEGNVLGYIHGTSRPKVLIEGHLDTVFAEATPLAVTEKEGRFYCPGIGDDTSALASNLSLLRAYRYADLQPVGTLVFGGTVGEEGEGNARGIRAIMRHHGDIDAVISVECYDEKYLVTDAVGIQRYLFTFKGPGGHSWTAFGLPNPIHAMSRAIAKIADLQTPASPKTTFSVGVVEGGTSINSIPFECSMKLDMRSISLGELDTLNATVLKLVDEAVAEENKRWNHKEKVSVEITIIGNKPAGQMDLESCIVHAAKAATEALGSVVDHRGAASTNQNIPVSMEVPSIVVGAGGTSGSHHNLEEWYDPKDAYKGTQKNLLLTLLLVGLEGVTDPLAEEITARGPVR